jgi:PAS domain S-box-containing protein
MAVPRVGPLPVASHMSVQDQTSRESIVRHPLVAESAASNEEQDAALVRAISPDILSFLVENANEGVYIMDEDRNILFANATACRISGYSRPELIGMNVHDLDPGAALSTPAVVRKRAYDGERTVFETMHRTKSGKMIPVEVSLVSGIFEGRILHYSFVRDITA